MAVSEEAQTAAAVGLADAARKSPLAAVVVLETILILGFAWWAISKEHERQDAQELQQEALQQQLIECLRARTKTKQV